MRRTLLLVGLFATIPVITAAEDVGDTPEGAKNTSTSGRVKETLVSPADVDFFKFDVKTDKDYPGRDTSGKLTMTFSQKAPPGANPQAGWRIDLYSEEDLATALHTGILRETSLETTFEQGLSPGRYYYKVSSINSEVFPTKEYALQSAWLESTHYEKSLNNNTETATAIRANEDYYGNLASLSDVDVYRLTLQAPDLVTITLSQETLGSDSTVGWQMSVLSPSLQQQEHANVPLTTLSGTVQVNLDVGIHYIFVKALPPAGEEEAQAPVGREYKIIANAPTVPPSPQNCEFIFTYAQNPVTQHWAMFPTPCDVPTNWVSQTTQPALFEVCPSQYAAYTSPEQNKDGIGMLTIPLLTITDNKGGEVLTRIDLQQIIQQTPEGTPLYSFQPLLETFRLIRVLKEVPAEETPAP